MSYSQYLLYLTVRDGREKATERERDRPFIEGKVQC